MQISYQLTEDDYRQGYKAFRRRTKYSLWAIGFAYVSLCFVFMTALLISIFGNRSDRSLTNLTVLWAASAFLFYCLWYAPRHAARKMMNGSPSASLSRTVDMSEEGLYFRTAASESRLTWDLITGWAEADRVFALFPSPLSFLPVPKRAMTDQQQNELRTLLQSKVSARRNLRQPASASD